MFPITEAWNGYEIDDAVLEEYNASVMEISTKLIDHAGEKAWKQGKHDQALRLYKKAGQREHENFKKSMSSSGSNNDANEESEKKKSGRGWGAGEIAAAAGAGYAAYKGGKYLYNKAKEKINDYRYRHGNYGIG